MSFSASLWNKKRTVHILIAILLSLAVHCSAEELAVNAFSREGLAGWETKFFNGTTIYKPVMDNGRQVIKAESNGTGSGLIKKIKFDPAKYRYLKWSWKVDHTVVVKGDERLKGGDDYAARVYVVFPGAMFWQTKAINYVWAHKLPKGEPFPNPYAKNVVMMPLQAGDAKAGTWVSEERDIFVDYQKLFGAVPTEAVAIAIMTDTDNTGGRATAWYGDITLSSVK